MNDREMKMITSDEIKEMKIREYHNSKWYKIRHGNGRIYFLITEDRRYIKIGYSINVPNRILDLQKSCPLKLILIEDVKGSINEERRLHIAARKYSKHGEWYYFNEQLLNSIMKYVGRKRLMGIADKATANIGAI